MDDRDLKAIISPGFSLTIIYEKDQELVSKLPFLGLSTAKFTIFLETGKPIPVSVRQFGFCLKHLPNYEIKS